MWLLLNDAFLSIVQKDCERCEVLVRARRVGDIEKIFGRRARVTKNGKTDYLFRATLTKEYLKEALACEIDRIVYPNFKDSVADEELHRAYLEVWTALARLQRPKRPVLKMKKNDKGNKGGKNDH